MIRQIDQDKMKWNTARCCTFLLFDAAFNIAEIARAKDACSSDVRADLFGKENTVQHPVSCSYPTNYDNTADAVSDESLSADSTSDGSFRQ